MKVRGILLALALALPVFAGAQTVDLLWQGKTYTPPLYPGRSLWSNQSILTVVAIPHVGSGSASTLVYKWYTDGDLLSSISGTGKRTLSLADSVLSRPIEIRVDVLSPDGSETLASNTILLTPHSSELLVVEDNPLYGLLLNKAIGSEYHLTEDEISFVALPLFSKLASRNSEGSSYVWSTNTGDTRTGNRTTYRIPESASGSSEVSVRFTNASTLMLPLTKSFLVQFGKTDI